MSKQFFIFFAAFFFSILNYSQTAKFNKTHDIWIVKAVFPSIGELKFYTVLKKQDSLFILKSIEDRDKFILGGFKAKLLRVIQNRKYKKSLVALEISNNKGKIHSLFGAFQLKDVVTSENNIKGVIYSNDNLEKIGDFSCEKKGTNEYMYSSINNYKILSDSVINVASQYLYNPELIQSNKWRNFSQIISEKSPLIYDDLEYLVLFFANVKNVGFSHFSLNKININLERTLNEKQIETKIINDSIVLLKFKTLSGKTSEIDSVFEKFKKFKTKILDLRDTPGGNFKSTFCIASHIIKNNINAGTFITRNCFLDSSCKEHLGNLPTLNINGINNFSQILSKNKGVQIILYPSTKQNSMDEKFYVLISKNTASACEPLVYGLKKEKNIIVVGENTAGSILSPSIFDIGQNYYLILPTADYLTSDGNSLDGTGVAPNIKIKSDDALDFVLKELKK
ncbi:hypothetical protein AAIP78_001022 [Flavobacterium psychrophilum]